MYAPAGAGTGAGPTKAISPESNNRRVARTVVKPTTKKQINSVIDPSLLTADHSSTVGKRPSPGRNENHNVDNISSTRFWARLCGPNQLAHVLLAPGSREVAVWSAERRSIPGHHGTTARDPGKRPSF
jgi:hypothetical protein